jgi:hypothetical protein
MFVVKTARAKRTRKYSILMTNRSFVGRISRRDFDAALGRSSEKEVGRLSWRPRHWGQSCT